MGSILNSLRLVDQYNLVMLFFHVNFAVVFALIWIRYAHIKGHYADSPAKVQLLNTVSFYCGFASILGILMVSSFQVTVSS